ncbi:aminodeoxychorismate lyase [Arsenicicoccus sp. oral taxon 190]|uniref:aminodeoxychorismate lyase n=1 Tax=Arsenicicoccus sp. oral taxon 190 TaxID=1658671 RepID=UPI0009E3CC41|nr:aminodeoxychorismate lyase [Arsenicicoccus sp. oral taxon 190]
MQQVVAVMGRGVVDAGTPIATGDDLGITRGDGCFDATLVAWDGEGWLVHDLDEHLARLRRSADALAIPLADDDAWIELIGDALQVWQGADEAALKLVLTRGDEHGDGTPLAFLTLTSVAARMIAQRDGIRVVTLPRGYASDAFEGAPWLLGGVKLLSYAVHVAAKREAAARGADDPVFTSSDGYVLEAPTSAVVWLRDGVVGTTPTGGTGILDSISARKILGGAGEHGWRGEQRLVTPTELAGADAAWLVSSVRGVAPILELDGVPLRTDPEATRVIRALNGF